MFRALASCLRPQTFAMDASMDAGAVASTAATPLDAGADQPPALHEVDQPPATHAAAEAAALHGGAQSAAPFQRLSKAEKRARKAESLKERRVKKREHQKQGRKRKVEGRREDHEARFQAMGPEEQAAFKLANKQTLALTLTLPTDHIP